MTESPICRKHECSSTPKGAESGGASVRSSRRALCAAMAVVLVVALSACGIRGRAVPVGQGPGATATSTQVVAADAVVPVAVDDRLETTMTVDDMAVSVSAPSGVVDTPTTLNASPVDASKAPKAGAATVVTGSGVELSFADGAQPSAGVEVVLDMSKQSDFATRVSASELPIVISDAGDPENVDLFAPEWDASAQTLTFTTYHFTPFWVGLLDVRSMWNSVTSTVRQASDDVKKQLSTPQTSPSCAENPTLDGKNLSIEIDPLIDVSACVEVRNGRAVVKLSSRSTQYFEVKSSAGGTYEPIGTPDFNALVIRNLPRSREVLGLLTPGLDGELTLPEGVTDARITVNVNPVYSQLATLGFAADIVVGGPMKGSLGGLEAAPEVRDKLDCSLGLLGSAADGDGSEFSLALTDCLVSLAKEGGSEAMLRFINSAKSVYSLVRTGGAQLWANVAGIIGEVNGANHVKITLYGDKPAQFSMVLKMTGLVGGSKALPTPFELDRYTKSRSVYSSWELTETPRGGCTARIVITGPQTADKSTNRCSGDPSTSLGLEVKTPGDYRYVFTLTGADGRELGRAEGSFTALPAPPR